MTDQDRGAYTPQTDAPLAFDARRVRGASGGPAPVTLVLSAAVGLLLVIAALLFYHSGVRGAGQPPQLVGAPVGQTKTPAAPDSAAPSGEPSLQILRSEAAAPQAPSSPTFTPAPETPAPRPAPEVQGPPPPAPTLRPAQSEAGGEASAPAAPPVAAPPVTASSAHLAPAEPIAGSKPARPLTAKPVVAKALAAKPLAAAPPATAPIAGEPLVQIGAFSSAALAQKGWSDVAALLPTRMAGRTAKVEKADRDGKVFYRSLVGGFGSAAQAQSFCAALKAAGKSCIVR